MLYVIDPIPANRPARSGIVGEPIDSPHADKFSLPCYYSTQILQSNFVQVLLLSVGKRENKIKVYASCHSLIRFSLKCSIQHDPVTGKTSKGGLAEFIAVRSVGKESAQWIN